MSLLRIAPLCTGLLFCAPAAAAVPRQMPPSFSFMQLEAVQGTAGRRPQKVQTHKAISAQDTTAHDEGNIDVDDIVKQLSALNTSYGKVVGLVDFVNATAMELLSQVATVIDNFQAVLPALRMAVVALKIVPGSDDLTDWANKFIDTANKTVDAFDGQVATIPVTVGKALDLIMPEFQGLMDNIYFEFTDAAEQVAALQNATEGKPKLQASVKDISLLMKSRALRSDAKNALQSETMDSTVSAKGASKCTKADRAIKKANASVGEFADEIEDLNGTAFALLDEVLGTAGTGLELLNATVMAALEPAQVMIPASILEPITTGLAALMQITDSLMATVNEALPEIEEQIQEAEAPLESVMAVADELQAAADKACAG